jgi:hypothetical protein
LLLVINRKIALLSLKIHSHIRDAEIRGGWPDITIHSPELLYGGEHFGSLGVIPTPGHTPGHIALRDQNPAFYWLAMLYKQEEGLPYSGVKKPFFLFPAIATWDISAPFDSVEKLLDFQPYT